MNLTSLARTKYALGFNDEVNDGVLLRLIATSSDRIEGYLRRRKSLELVERREYLNTTAGQRSFYLAAYPVASIASIEIDASGRYSGSEVDVSPSDYLLSADERQLVLSRTCLSAAFRGVRVTYTGGLAPSGTLSRWTTTEQEGLHAGKYIQGAVSGALGRLVQVGEGFLRYDSIYGIFEPGEAVKQYPDWNFVLLERGPSGDSDGDGVLGERETENVAEKYPSLSEAAQQLVQYYWQNRDNLSNITTNFEGGSKISRSDLKTDFSFTPEIRDLLEDFRDRLIQ